MSESLPVEALRAIEPGRWCGKVRFPNRLQPTAILIFALDGAWAGLRAHCPHEGYDLSDCRPDETGALVCPLHGLSLPLRGPAALSVSREGDAFAVSWSPPC